MYKDNIYNNFKCIADKCSMTCCKGWAIRVENDCFDRWKNNDDTAYLCDKVKAHKTDGEICYQMKQTGDSSCVMLDENGLCELVKCHGDSVLSDTCASFPRKHNKIYELDEDSENIIKHEYSLSGACPEALRLIEKADDLDEIKISQKCDGNQDFPMEYRIRNAVIELLQLDDISLDDKLMLSFSLLHESLECEWEDDVYDCIEVYQDKENLIDNIMVWNKAKLDEKEALIEVCQTLIDVTQYYKEEPMYRSYIYEIADYLEQFDERDNIWDDLLAEWKNFKTQWSVNEKFYTRVLISEIYGDCISEDIEYLIEMFQSIVTEYVMTRISVFIKQVIEKRSLSEEEIRDYFALYIRMIGHNADGMAEYWEESFEDSILEKEYFYMMLR